MLSLRNTTRLLVRSLQLTAKLKLYTALYECVLSIVVIARYSGINLNDIVQECISELSLLPASENRLFTISTTGSVAQWLWRWTCDWRSRVQSQPLHCRVQLWTSCSHTLSSASGVTTLWRYMNQFKLKKLARVNGKHF